ncbi:MAG: hypothetical protein ACOYNS_05830 [Bacteroidota bacterium]
MKLQSISFVNNYSLKIFTLIIFLLFGCKKESETPVQPVAERSSWKLNVLYFRAEKILLNSFASKDTLTIAGFNSISLFDTSTLNPSRRVFANDFSSMAFKPVFGNNFWMYGGANGVQFVLFSPVYLRGNTTSALPFFWGLRLHDLDSSYSVKTVALPNYYTNPIGAFNSKGQFLSAVSDTDGCSFCLIDLHTSYSPSYAGILASISPAVTKIKLNGNDKYISYVPFISSYKDNYFVSSNQGNYIVYPNGSYRKLTVSSGSFVDMFNIHDTLYSLTSNAELFRSLDNGENWAHFAGNFPSSFSRHFMIGEKVYFYVYSQLFSADLSTGKIQEIDNTGLEYNEITSVNMFGDKVLVTTLSGLFYKPISEFLMYKTPATASKGPNRIESKRLELHQ